MPLTKHILACLNSFYRFSFNIDAKKISRFGLLLVIGSCALTGNFSSAGEKLGARLQREGHLWKEYSCLRLEIYLFRDLTWLLWVHLLWADGKRFVESCRFIMTYTVNIIVLYACRCKQMKKTVIPELVFIPSLLALNGGGRFLSPSSPLSSLLCSLVSWETLSALLSKLKYYGLTGLLMQLTPSKLGFRGTWLPWWNVRSRLYDGAWERWRIVCLAALSVEDIDIYLFGTMITGILLIGLGSALGYRRIQKTGTAVQSPTRLPYDWSCGKSGQHWDWTIIAIWILPRRSSQLYKGKLIKMRPKWTKTDRE